MYDTVDRLEFDTAGVRQNKNGRTRSAFFVGKSTKTQLGDFDEEPWTVKALLEEQDGSEMKGIRLTIDRKNPALRWFKDLECSLVHAVQKKSNEFFSRDLETYQVQDLFQSIRHGTSIDLRLASNVNVYLFDESKPTKIPFTDVKPDVLCIPIVQIVGIWIEDDSAFGMVAKVTDLMCFEEEDTDDDSPQPEMFSRAVASSKDLHKAEWGTSGADSPVESMWGASLYPAGKMRPSARR